MTFHEKVAEQRDLLCALGIDRAPREPPWTWVAGKLEPRVLNVLRTRLVDPALFAKFCDVFTREVNRLRMGGRANIAAAETEIRKIDRELDTLLDLVLKGGADKIMQRWLPLNSGKKEVETFLAEADEPPPLLHPSMAELYRSRASSSTICAAR